jgi:hypothetical protein
MQVHLGFKTLTPLKRQLPKSATQCLANKRHAITYELNNSTNVISI